jgi:hypothetical protein
LCSSEQAAEYERITLYASAPVRFRRRNIWMQQRHFLSKFRARVGVSGLLLLSHFVAGIAALLVASASNVPLLAALLAAGAVGWLLTWNLRHGGQRRGSTSTD